MPTGSPKRSRWWWSLACCAALAAVAALTLAQRSDSAWKAQIPKVWDDEAVASLEIPLQQPEFSPEHVDSAYYYAIRPREIYKSYPVYHPDREPEGYWEWLHEQEPEIVFDPSELETKEDWIRAGELVFTEGNRYSAGQNLETIRDPAVFETIRVPLAREGVVPYLRYFVREKGIVEIGIGACATCHTRVLDDGTVVPGAAGNFPLGEVVARDLLAEGAALDPEILRRQSESLDSTPYRLFGAPWLEPGPGKLLLDRPVEYLAELNAAQIPGVHARQGSSPFTPVRIPDLIGVEDRLYLDATGLVQHRSIGDLMRYAALNQGADMLSSFGGFVPFAPESGQRPDPKIPLLSRYSDAQLYALALYLYSLTPPRNPNPFDASAERGQAIFAAGSCARCHTPPLYTNNRLTPADGFTPPPENAREYRTMSAHVGTDSGLTMGTRRGTGYYKVPSLKGVWYRGPFLHDGSLATLEDVFDPDRLSDDYVPTGFRPVGVERRAVPGHRYGMSLTAEERADLVAFLRTL